MWLNETYGSIQPVDFIKANSCPFASDPSSPVSEDIFCIERDVFHLLCAVDIYYQTIWPDGIPGYLLKGKAESIASS